MDKTPDQIKKMFGFLPTIFLNNMPNMQNENPCVLAPEGAETKMTWNSFASACLWKRSKNKTHNLFCTNCEIGKAIERGERVSPPDDMTIIEPDGWNEQPIKQPPKHWVAASKYNFHTMEIGDIYIDNIENAKRCRSAKRNIAIRHGREFSIKTVGNEIQITRVK